MLYVEKYLFFFVATLSIYAHVAHSDCYAHTIFVPRYMAYNPMYEDALIFDQYAHMDNHFLFSIKPVYTQTVGSTLNNYFTINHACSMNVQENGSGDIDSLWFQVISTPGVYYSSTLSFRPLQKTAGALLYGAVILPGNCALTVNTAFVKRRNTMRICETNINRNDLGQATGFSTITQAFASSSMEYGKICGSQAKGGVDDVQIKLLKNFSMCDDESLFGDIYLLVGVPTGHGSKAVYLFEPIVGSNHVQFGLGLNGEKSFECALVDRCSLYGEFKWRYGFKARETRSFDMTPNGQWSRYMLFTTPTANANKFFAINDLTFKAEVTPRSSFDILLAAHIEQRNFSFELGYNFWYRQEEKVCPCITLPQVGIADLVGIAELSNPMPIQVTTSSSATISEGVYPNQYQMPRDASYTLVTTKNINTASGAQATSLANGIFGSLGYHYKCLDVGINTSYEHAGTRNTASIVSVWFNLGVNF